MVVVDDAPSEQYPHVLAHFLRMVLAVDGFLQVSIIHGPWIMGIIYTLVFLRENRGTESTPSYFWLIYEVHLASYRHNAEIEKILTIKFKSD